MKISQNFLAYIKAFKGREALVISCNNDGLRYLWNIFGQRFCDETFSSVKIVNDGEITSDGLCELEIVKGELSSLTRIERKSDKEFVWLVSLERAEFYRDLLVGMLPPGPGHQYFDSDDPLSPVVVVTKEEYPIDFLRSMRDGVRPPKLQF